LEAFAQFRKTTGACRFKYFYQRFNPNIDLDLDHEALGSFMNDAILRLFSGLTRAERPELRKIAYNGPAALEELASFDSELSSVFLTEARERHAIPLSCYGRRNAMAAA
jgi:hypothetical protein